VSTHIFTDSEILELIDHPKSLPYNWRGIARVVSARSKIVQTVKVISDSDFSFELKLNQNQINFRKFSLILGFYKPDILNKLFHLRDMIMGMDIQILLKETFLVLPIYILQQKGIKGLHLKKKMDSQKLPTDS